MVCSRFGSTRFASTRVSRLSFILCCGAANNDDDDDGGGGDDDDDDDADLCGRLPPVSMMKIYSAGLWTRGLRSAVLRA